MNPFHRDRCPLCLAQLIVDHTSGVYGTGDFHLYNCPDGHYFMSWNEQQNRPEYSQVSIPGYMLSYGLKDTAIYRFTNPQETSYMFLFYFPGHFPINWNVPERAAKQIKNLLVFS